ncbi:Protein of unknown function [Cotesia congregata]|uniref:Uncharacterized protein n=1 Tax=Cotesia congregata TaxID=51543 RepID=A0A8J2HIF9_COTCN|nr:Protein of unknown function [Cotesia congregata]
MLSEFKEAANGDLEKKALFDYWFKISNNSTGVTTKQNPVIKSIEIYNDHHNQHNLKNDLNTNQPYLSNDIVSNTNSSTDFLYTIDQELPNLNIETINTLNINKLLESIIIEDNDSSVINSEETSITDDGKILEFILKSGQVNNEEQPTDNNNVIQSTLSNLNEDNFIELEIHIVYDNSIVPVQHGEITTELTITHSKDPVINENHQVELEKENLNGVSQKTDIHRSIDETTSTAIDKNNIE